jgi:glycosyltransferase involved in cell wall biosynthesis
MTPTISVVIHTLNEERNLPSALRSVRTWADDVVVIDMGSEDRTGEIARALGARVVGHERTGFVEPARAFGSAQAHGDWILLLDADEMVPEPLSRRLRTIANSDEADVVRLPRLNHILGGPLRHTGWNPDRDLSVRFFKRDRVEVPPWIHASPLPRPGSRVLDVPPDPSLCIVHFNYLDVSHFLFKLDVYTGIEAAEAAGRGEPPRAGRALARAAREWLARYAWHRGFADGWRGLTLSLTMALYHVLVYAKGMERLEAGTRDEVQRRYREEAERLLRAYEER